MSTDSLRTERRFAARITDRPIPARDFPKIAEEYLEGRLPLDVLISERIGLEQLDGAFDAMRRGDGARRVIMY